MIWEDTTLGRLPVRSWCRDLEPDTLRQATNLANHPATVSHVALMPDCHVGFGMPIGGVIACDAAVIPNAVGVDIGCGMVAVRTSQSADELTEKDIIRLLQCVKRQVPVGEGRSHSRPQEWEGFEEVEELPGGVGKDGWQLARCSLGSLGGGNHFIEIQSDTEGFVWLMVHSGSRNLGYRIASYYHKRAIEACKRQEIELPDPQLAYLATASRYGRDYLRDMDFALRFAAENRRRMMLAFKNCLSEVSPSVEFFEEINIHHNYAALEEHGGRKVWLHRKGATSAWRGQKGIIPGSMGTASYIVEGLGNPASFMSCSHGAGRRMSRTRASAELTREECDRAMEGIVFDGWKMKRRGFGKGRRTRGGEYLDLEEAPQAYKDIEDVMASQTDLVKIVARLRPLGVVKG